jgi:hypothetical protein
MTEIDACDYATKRRSTSQGLECDRLRRLLDEKIELLQEKNRECDRLGSSLVEAHKENFDLKQALRRVATAVGDLKELVEFELED